jgi:hypothetical protein
MKQEAIQHVADSAPPWVNWTVIVGSAVASWLAPIASLVGIIWGGLQIYSWFEKRRCKRNSSKRRVTDK